MAKRITLVAALVLLILALAIAFTEPQVTSAYYETLASAFLAMLFAAILQIRDLHAHAKEEREYLRRLVRMLNELLKEEVPRD